MKRRLSTCKYCGDQILWARQAGGKKWYPLVPEIVGQPRHSDFPLNEFDPEKGTCNLVNSLVHAEMLPDQYTLHRRHECSKRSLTQGE